MQKPLDHNAYPHVLETILDHAPPCVLSAFRQTSHHFRNQADVRSAHHMVFGKTLHSKNKVLILPLDWPLEERTATLLKHTRVLDIHDNSARWPNVFDFFRLSPPLDIVRIYAPLGSTAHLPLAKTVLCNAPFYLLPEVTHPKLVFYYDETSIKVEALYNGYSHMEVSELVIMCPPRNMREISAAYLSAELAILWRTTPGLKVGRITVVDMGAETTPDKFIDLVKHVAQRQSGETIARIGRIDWRFISREEYAAELGEEERVLTVSSGGGNTPPGKPVVTGET